MISSLSHKNLTWQNVLKSLDLDTIGQEQLISDGTWYDEELLSDNEVLKKKEEIIEKMKAGEEVERDYFFRENQEQSSIPVNPDSKRMTIVRRVNPAQMCKKNLHGIYESLPECAAFINANGTTITTKDPGQKETDISKSDISTKGKKKEIKETKAAVEPRMNILKNKEELVKRVQDPKHEFIEEKTG